MKTNEFIARVSALPYVDVKAEQSSDGATFVGIDLDDPIMTINVWEGAESWFDVNVAGKTYSLSPKRQKELANLITEYLATPVKERKEEKKYYLEVMRYCNGPIPDSQYVERFECSPNYTKAIYGTSTEFTESDLRMIIHRDPALEAFINDAKTPVEDD